MIRHTNRTTVTRGAALVEFSFSLLFLVPLLLGTLVYGFRLVRSIEMLQITRDLGHMYLRGVNFRNDGPKQNAQTLAAEFKLTSNGSSVVVLSAVRLVDQADCDAAGTAPKGAPCANLNQPGFLEQIILGNSSAGASVFGTPPLKGDLTVPVGARANSPSAQAAGFPMVLKTGEVAYVAEMINLTPELNIPGLSGKPQVYARSIF